MLRLTCPRHANNHRHEREGQCKGVKGSGKEEKEEEEDGDENVQSVIGISVWGRMMRLSSRQPPLASYASSFVMRRLIVFPTYPTPVSNLSRDQLRFAYVFCTLVKFSVDGPINTQTTQPSLVVSLVLHILPMIQLKVGDYALFSLSAVPTNLSSQTMLNCIDNSGAAIVECAKVLKMKRAATVGSSRCETQPSFLPF